MVFIGADWDSKKCVVAFERDGKVHRRVVARNPEDVRAFLDGLGGDEICVGIEDGDRLWQRLWANAGAEVFVFDGKKARRFSESLNSSGARDDTRSAYDLRCMVMSSAHREEANRVELGAPAGLEHLHRTYDVASGEVIRHESRLRSLLGQFHPAVADWASPRLHRSSVLDVLEAAPTAAAYIGLTDAERDAVLGRLRASQRDALSQTFATDWGAVDASEEDAIRFSIRSEIAALRAALQRKADGMCQWK